MQSKRVFFQEKKNKFSFHFLFFINLISKTSYEGESRLSYVSVIKEDLFITNSGKDFDVGSTS